MTSNIKRPRAIEEDSESEHYKGATPNKRVKYDNNECSQ